MFALTPFLLFDGNCAEAMRFYHACFGGDLTLIPLSETPMKAQFSPEQHHKISYSQLKSGAIDLSATDWLHPTRHPVQGNTTAIYLTGAGYDELSPIFDKLREGAESKFLDELRAMPFGTYGHLIDRYGVGWFFRGAAAAS